MVRTPFLALCCLGAICFVAGCSGGGTSSASNTSVSITSLSPPSLPAGSPSQVLTINGSGFLSSTTVTFNSSAHTATFVNTTQLTIVLTSDDLATPGSYPVVVTNSAPNSVTTDAMSFNVTANNPVPMISSLSGSGISECWPRIAWH